MKKGIVMEINDNFLTLLTPDGQFLQAKKRKNQYTLGEEILFVPSLQKKNIKRFWGMKQLSVAAAVFCILLGSLFPIYQNNKAYAYMSIDVNPSIEIGINKKMEALQVTTFNAEGKKIMSHIGDWKKSNVTQLTKKILKEMKKEGYLRKNHTLLLSTVRTGNPEVNTENQLAKDIGEIEEMAKENNLKVTVFKGTEKEREKAHQMGVTTGKYKETKIESGKKSTNRSPEKRSSKGNSDEINGQAPTLTPDENGAVAPNESGVNNENNGQANKTQGNSAKNQTPPGQINKAEETPNNNQFKQENNSYKNEKKTQQENKNKNQKQLENNGNKK